MVIDTRGLRCPWPVLRAQKAMRQGQAFVLLADDIVALTDVPLAADACGWTCVTEQDGERTAHFHLSPAAPHPA